MLLENMKQTVTVKDLLTASTHYLEQNGIEEAKENAELLFLYVTGWSRTNLLLNRFEPKSEEWLEQYASVIERKSEGEPFQYITGEQYFFGRKFMVNEHVLIPRPETELLVEKVLQTIKQKYGELPVTILDVGTGSGAIALTLKAEMPHINVIASDISADALLTAKANADALELDVTFVEGDLLTPFIEHERLIYNEQGIDVLVSNPPYIPDGDKGSLQIEVEKFEPHLALFGGVDGLYPYKKMLKTVADVTNPPAIVAFELGIHQPSIVAKHMDGMGIWTSTEIVTDYNGIERHIIAVKK